MGQRLKKIWSSAKWVVRPFTLSLKDSGRLSRTGYNFARNISQHLDQSFTENPRHNVLLRRSRLKARFYGAWVVLLSVLCFYEAMLAQHRDVANCLIYGALILIGAAQALSAAFENWTLRRQQRGSFGDFITSGPEIWPR
ncbi:hypothetical protein [Neokomagataea thailandica]|uniref:hypothetical protein n=1 Tax=Neokomagataea TaxID=1223423 RepID=UPI00082C68BB|nr:MULTISPECIES: hypothetical protein [Neokomagataea]